ncbi:Deoxyhypusine synthase isoform 2 [Schistosoma japonicum]|uniref:deoxyhypusine synthase n=1 Tax=Schistosoma japonicum TaxID=6182 RepID=A0A4Z2DSQ6_SCHJA|nr:Deoxyhypusine synthase isoform 2 [Schistosoma japonicum]
MQSQPKYSCNKDRPPGFVDAVLKPSTSLPEGVNLQVKGYDFNDGLNYDDLFSSFECVGFQATHFAKAEYVLNEMINRRNLKPNSNEEIELAQTLQDFHPLNRPLLGCTIFLAYTSNMVSSGVREVIRFLAEHNLVDVIVTSAGGVEEDFIKCLAPSYIGDFEKWRGHELREIGVNRIGNLLVPNNNYVEFEQWLLPILDQALEEQNSQNINWTPSKLINRLGKEINHKDSIYYWCYKNKIPVFCPGLTDGSLGDVLFSHTYRSPGFKIDLVEDIRSINLIAINARSTGMIVLGGGLIKHHTFNANLMRNGADYCVLINTGQEFDGSDSGARPDEAVSWGKIKGAAEPVKINADASLIFPILVARTFVKQIQI